MSRSYRDLLAIFYFGDSRALVKEDSDIIVFASFHPELCQTASYERHARKSVWSSMFDEMLQALAEERPAMTPEQICERVAQIPSQARMIDAVCMAAELFSADVKVIVDRNTFCIESLMHRSELSQHVKKVFANPVEYETLSDGRTR
ncbi:unnamed protein product [Peronospora destructor]|nr:unnamed protein product [Peronospora destructor]